MHVQYRPLSWCSHLFSHWHHFPIFPFSHFLIDKGPRLQLGPLLHGNDLQLGPLSHGHDLQLGPLSHGHDLQLRPLSHGHDPAGFKRSFKNSSLPFYSLSFCQIKFSLQNTFSTCTQLANFSSISVNKRMTIKLFIWKGINNPKSKINWQCITFV